jgi:hypothetical protein
LTTLEVPSNLPTSFAVVADKQRPTKFFPSPYGRCRTD